MSDTLSSSAISLPCSDHGKTPDARPRLKPLYISRGIAVCAALAWLLALSPTQLTAGPKYRAFHNTCSAAKPVTDVRLAVAANQHLGEVSDSPPVFIDGQFSTIGNTSIFKSLFNNPQKPVAPLEKVSPESEHRYLLKANNLHQDLASMAALYRSLADVR